MSARRCNAPGARQFLFAALAALIAPPLALAAGRDTAVAAPLQLAALELRSSRSQSPIDVKAENPANRIDGCIWLSLGDGSSRTSGQE